MMVMIDSELLEGLMLVRKERIKPDILSRKLNDQALCGLSVGFDTDTTRCPPASGLSSVE
jgi:hypothetical protein